MAEIHQLGISNLSKKEVGTIAGEKKGDGYRGMVAALGSTGREASQESSKSFRALLSSTLIDFRQVPTITRSHS